MAKLNKTPLTIRAKRGTESQITSYTGYQLSGEFAYATDTNNLYVSNGTTFLAVAGATPTLQSVTDEGNTTTNAISASGFTVEGAQNYDMTLRSEENTGVVIESPREIFINTSRSTYFNTDTDGGSWGDRQWIFGSSRQYSTGGRTYFKIGNLSGYPFLSLNNHDNNEQVRFDSNGNSYINGGNVGIGTTAPQQKLHVDGTIRIGADVDLSRYAGALRTGQNFVLGAPNFEGANLTINAGSTQNAIGVRRPPSGTTSILKVRDYSTQDVYVDIDSDGVADFAGMVKTDTGFEAYRVGARRVFLGGTSVNGQLLLDSGGTWDVNLTGGSNKYFAQGNFGIGTTAPSEKLDVQESTLGNDILNVGYTSNLSQWQGTGTVLKATSTYNATWNAYLPQVGIGTETPEYTLDIRQGGPLEASLNLQGTYAQSPYYRADSYYGTIEINNRGWFRTRRKNGQGGDFIVYTGLEGQTSWNAKFIVTNAGNVGIGTTAPSTLLHLRGDSPTLRIEADGANESSIIELVQDGGVTGAAIKYNGASNIEALQFNTGVSDVRMTIKRTNGNVGIGTTAPNAKTEITTTEVLDVAEVGIGLKINADQTGTAGTGGATKYGVVIESSQTFNKNLFTRAVGLYIPAYDGTVYAGDFSAHFEGKLLLGGNDSIYAANSYGILNLLGQSSTDNVNENTIFIGGVGIAGEGNYITGITTGSNSANLSSAIHFVSGGATRQSHIAFKSSRDGNLAERMRITDEGNVGIGTTAPSEKLHIQGNFGNNTFKVKPNSDHTIIFADQELRVGTTNNADVYITPNGLKRATFKADGSVGIGVGSPTFTLESAANSSGNNLRLRSNSNNGGASIAFSNNDASESWGGLGASYITPGTSIATKLGFSAVNYLGYKTTIATMTTTGLGIATSDVTHRFVVKNIYNNTTSIVQKNSSDAINFAVGNTGANQDGILSLHDGGSTGQVVLNSNGNSYINGGNVGIGTTAPTDKLEVNTGGVNSKGIKIAYDSSNYVTFSKTTSANFDIKSFIGDSEYGAIHFGNSVNIKTTNGSGGINFSRGTSTLMLINNAGNVGIGTTAPAAKLHVDGYALFGTDTSTGYYFGPANRFSIGGQRVLEKSGASVYVGYNANDLVFRTNNLERGRFNTAGNFGIGTAAPDSKLHVKATSGIAFKVDPNSADKEWYIDTTNPDHLKKEGNLILNADPTNVHTSTKISFNIDGANKASINSDGDLGVGTTAQTSKVHVDGTAMRQLRMGTSGGPSSNTDTSGAIGDMAYDDNYFYIKTINGWGRVALDFGF